MGDLHRSVQRFLRGGREPDHHRTVELRVGESPRHPLLREETLGGEVTAGSVVLVKGMDHDPSGLRPHRVGEGGAEGVAALVADPDPIKGAEHDRMPRP
jgi:hypothetical protein